MLNVRRSYKRGFLRIINRYKRSLHRQRKLKQRSSILLKIKNNRRKVGGKMLLFFLKKSTNNYFLTITNKVGDVILFISYGQAKIFSKKRRKSPESFKVLVSALIKKIKSLKLKNRFFKYVFITRKGFKKRNIKFLAYKLQKIK